MRYVDANVFLRFLTQDDPVQAERVKRLFESAQAGEVELVTGESVIAELVFVLASPTLYALGREEIRRVLVPLVSLKGLKLPGRRVILRALDLYSATTVDFVDALAVAQMEAGDISEIDSYDADFDRMPGIARLPTAPTDPLTPQPSRCPRPPAALARQRRYTTPHQP